MTRRPTVLIEIMRGSYHGMLALSIDDTRHGPDAGPWEIIGSIRVDAGELLRVVNSVLADTESSTTAP